MPIYRDLPVLLDFNELFVRRLLDQYGIRPTSILDVGAGHGGVFDYHHWDELPGLVRREACDLHWIRPMSERWTVRLGVDVTQLPYQDHEFDVVQCMEVLEHVPNTWRALVELVRVAKRFVVVTSADETHHQGPEQAAIERVNPHQKYLRQPHVEELQALGFQVHVDGARRQLFAWRTI